MNVAELAAKWGRSYRVARLYERDGGKCGICKCEMLFEREHQHKAGYATIDHIVPRSKSGANCLSNCRLACRVCNSRRGNAYQPEMGGVKADDPVRQPVSSIPGRSLRDLALHARCGRCDTRYAVVGWQSRHEDGLCPLCLMQ